MQVNRYARERWRRPWKGRGDSSCYSAQPSGLWSSYSTERRASPFRRGRRRDPHSRRWYRSLGRYRGASYSFCSAASLWPRWQSKRLAQCRY